MKPLDLINQRFGRLVVMYSVPAKPRRKWKCQCDCGNTTMLDTGHLRSGNTQSCGCLSPFGFRHGLSDTPLYDKYYDMRRRCYSPKCAGFKWYGARGIQVCEQWRKSPEDFLQWALSHGYQPGLELDRIDSDGDYTPENCRFVTHQENMRNKRKATTSIPYLAEQAGMKTSTVRSRLDRGWLLDRALATPVRELCGGRNAASK
jgi:hypothetical protein